MQRIVSLLSSATEMIYALGLGESLVAVSHECDYPAEAAAKPRATFSQVDSAAASRHIDDQVKNIVAAGGPLHGIDESLLARLKPDVVITQAQCDVCAVKYDDVVAAVERIDPAGATRIVSLNPASLADILADIVRVGEAVDRTLRAREVVRQLAARIEAVREKTKALADNKRPRTAIIEWIEPPMLAGNWMPELLEIAGGKCDLVAGGTHSTYADWRSVVEFDPEVIVISPCGFDLPRAIEEARALASFESWPQMTAVRTGRVFAVDGNAYFNRSGPRIVDSLEILAHLLHPELFRQPLAPIPFRPFLPSSVVA